MFTSVLNDNGFNSHFAQGIWKLVKGSFIIVKGKKCCILYKTNVNLV